MSPAQKEDACVNAALYGLFPERQLERAFAGYPKKRVRYMAQRFDENIESLIFVQAAKCQQQRRIHRCIELASLNSVHLFAVNEVWYVPCTIFRPTLIN